MLQSPVLLSLVVLFGVMLSPVSAAFKRGDQYDYPSTIDQSSLGPLNDIVSQLFVFPHGPLSPVYDSLREVGLTDGLAKTAAVLVAAAVALCITKAVDYMIQIVGSLAAGRSLSGTDSLTPEKIQSAIELIERAATLWE